MTRPSAFIKGNVAVLLTRRRHSLCANHSKALQLIKVNKAVLFLFVVFICLIFVYINSEILLRKHFFTFFKLRSKTAKHAINDQLSLLKESNTNGTQINKNVDSSFDYNVFVIYTKDNYQLHMKFELFTRSLLKHTNARLHLHIITDESSESSAERVLQQQQIRFGRPLQYSLYDVDVCSERIEDIVNAMTPFFSSTPKSYYSDTLFFLSLGLHRIANSHIDRAVLLDCDIVFRSDIRLLFDEFDRFSKEHLFGLAPELTPVYRHILYRYRANFPGTNFGSPYYHVTGGKRIKNDSENRSRLKQQHGYPGLNSGVVLLFLSRIRSSKIYLENLKMSNVREMTTKYSFKGHLGDQDFFTLLGYEFPNLIYRLDCVWNRQLCTWWKDHGYSDVFDAYFHCEGKVRMYHGNCNTRIPE